jgi:porin
MLITRISISERIGSQRQGAILKNSKSGVCRNKSAYGGKKMPWSARKRVLLAALAVAGPTGVMSQAYAESPAPNGADQAQGEPGFTTGLWTRGNLLGDMGGLRTALGNYGITIGLQETSEVLGNVTGGIHTGFDYDGLTLMNIGVDTQKAFGWEGGIFNVSALQIHGRNLSTDNLLTLQTASGIEAQATTRLWELWYQQSFLDGRYDVKIGQQSIDQEFITSAGSSVFINTMMGWPMLPSADLYAGGPAYPLSTLGVRFRANALGPFTVLAGVFDDNPPGGPFDDDSQLRGAERTGTRFNLGTGALFVAEVQYALNQPQNGEMDDGNKTSGLPGTYKLGAWYDTAAFPDQRYDSSGGLLADPLSSGDPKMRRRNFSLYGVFDQALWRPDPSEARTIGVFARIMGAPGDRNLISFSVNAGITMKAPLPGRDDDTFGIGWGIAKLSRNAIGFDRDTNTFSGPTPIRSTENFIEVTYQYQAAGWWQIQPDFQYVFQPGGGIANPLNPSTRVGNEAVMGVRTTITF